MKANRKFMNNDDEAVSPVIAVILMVAITVVLAATVYVWVSGFSGGNQGASASLSVSQVAGYADALAGTAATDGIKFTVTSVSPGFLLSSMKILDATEGRVFTLGVTASGCTAATVSEFVLLEDGATCKDADDTTQQLGAGDVLKFYFTLGDIGAGDSIQFVDTNSNNVISTIVLR